MHRIVLCLCILIIFPFRRCNVPATGVLAGYSIIEQSTEFALYAMGKAGRLAGELLSHLESWGSLAGSERGGIGTGVASLSDVTGSRVMLKVAEILANDVLARGWMVKRVSETAFFSNERLHLLHRFLLFPVVLLLSSI